MDERSRRTKLNISTSIIVQIVTAVSGLIIPQLLIRAFGSNVYGLTSSITQFLAYISLLEGGVTNVARAAIYKPLADNDNVRINSVYSEITGFFRTVGIVFIFYTVFLSSCYKFIVNDANFDWLFTFLLVIAISISTLAQYFFGISNLILTHADQKHYVNNIISIVVIILNTLLTIVLISIGFNIIWVKLLSSLVYLLRPLSLSIYVKKNYLIDKSLVIKGENYLTQKWTALGQHIAYFLHTNTAVVVLTFLTNLAVVSVYSVYHLIVSSIRSFALAFASGLEAVFGNMYAKGKNDSLNKVFSTYETLISVVSTILFSVTCVLILPFVKLYTAGVSDAEYIQPAFAFILVVSDLIFCVRIPYHYMVNAVGHFKQTKFAAYGEAVINIGLSLVLVFTLGLVGVAIASLVATAFRMIYYAFYLSRHVISRKFELFVKRQLVTLANFAIIAFAGLYIFATIEVQSFFAWIIYAIPTFITATLATLAINYVFYKDDVKSIISKFVKRA